MGATNQAKAAVRGAKHFREWGEAAALGFMRNQGIPAPMAQAAIEFELSRHSNPPRFRRPRRAA